jgi:hypothetical protein
LDGVERTKPERRAVIDVIYVFGFVHPIPPVAQPKRFLPPGGGRMIEQIIAKIAEIAEMAS